MKKNLMMVVCSVAIISFFTVTGGADVLITSNGFSYGDSWDNPSDEIVAVLEELQSEIYGDGSGDIHLNCINYGNSIVETWTAMGVQTVILEEIAGYSSNTTFGWYDLNSLQTAQIYAGADGKGAKATIDFDSLTDFGFYIDPNGESGNRMFTEHEKNTHGDYQVVIFEIEEASNQYILGWEDLDLNGDTGGDRDYQDMIIRATINPAPVPEPATMFLFGAGLIGLAGFRKKYGK